MSGEEAPAAPGPSMKQNDESLTVGVVVEKRKSNHPWIDHSWRAVAVIPGAPALEPRGAWKVLESGDDYTRYHAGSLPVALYRKETEAYRVNLTQEPPRVFIVMRKVSEEGEAEQEVYPILATASPYEAQDYLDSGEEIVEGVAMPDALIAFVSQFVGEHHVDEPFYKRKRKRYDPNDVGFGKRGPAFDDDGGGTRH
jgi:hypothetical protein